MSATQPLEIECPKCNQLYRFGANVPPQLTCKVCKTVMDLRAYATKVPPTPIESGGIGGKSVTLPSASRPRPAFKPRPPQSAAATWGVVALITVAVIFKLFVKFDRIEEQNRVPADHTRERLDSLFHPRNVTRTATVEDIGLASPKNGDVLTKSPAHLEGVFADPGYSDTILVNGKLARMGGGPWSSDVALTEGENTIEFAIVQSNEVYRGSIRVTYRPPK